MIKILIADALSVKTIDQLNEIPEFEIVEKTIPPADSSSSELKDIDAVIAPATTQWPPAVLENAVNLKIIILTGGGSDSMNTQMPKLKNITIRRIPCSTAPCAQAAKNDKQGRQEAEVITILKEFFNV